MPEYDLQDYKKFRGKVTKPPEETGLLGDITNYLKDFGSLQQVMFKQGDAIFKVMEEPGRLMGEGVSQLGENPIAGSVNITNSLLGFTAAPFAIVDALARELPGGDTVADVVAYPFEKVGEGAGYLRNKFARPVEKELLKLTGLDKDKIEAIQKAGDYQTEMLAQFGVGALLGGGVKAGKNLFKGKEKIVETPIEAPVKEVKQLEAPKRVFESTETGSTKLKGADAVDIGQLKLQVDELANKRIGLQEELKLAKGKKAKNKILKEITETTEQINLFKEEINKFGEYSEQKSLKGLLPEKTQGNPLEDVSGTNAPSNINFTVATEPGARTVTKLNSERLTPVKRGNIEDAKIIAETKPKETLGLEEPKKPVVEEVKTETKPLEVVEKEIVENKTVKPEIAELEKRQAEELATTKKIIEDSEVRTNQFLQEKNLTKEQAEALPTEQRTKLNDEYKGWLEKNFPELGERPDKFGSKNKVFTKEKFNEADKYQKENLNKLGANPFLDPQYYQSAFNKAGYYFEGGARKFADWSKKMVDDFGDQIKPLLLKLWADVQKEKPRIEEAKKVAETGAFGEGMQNVSTKTRDQIKQEYREVVKEKEKTSTKLKGIVKDTQGVKKIAKDILEPITTSVEKVSKDVFRRFRQFGQSYQQNLLQRHKAVGDFLEKKSKAKLDADTQADFNISLMNGWFDDAKAIAKKHGFEKELDNVLQMKDKLAQELGVKTIENHFPRMVEDFDGFVKLLEERFPDYYRDNFERMIVEKAHKVGRELTVEEKATLINNALRGYNPGITLSDVGNMKKRVIQTLDGEMAKFYHSPDASLLQYVNQMTELAEARKFFGKKGFDVMDSIGAYVQELRDGKKLNLEGSRELMEIFKARFNQRGITNKSIEVLRDIGVITKLGNPYSTVTQLKDLAYSMYFDPLHAPIEFGKIIGQKISGKQPKWQIEELGIDPLKIAEELASPKKRAKIVQGFLDYSGFSKLDMIGKETLINTLWDKYTKQSKELKLNTEFERRIERYFGKGEEKIKVLKDLREGKKTDSTSFLLYNELVGAQPISLIEMPRAYLRGGNWRIAYFLKTFAIRQLDFALNETVRVMKDKTLPKEQRKQGAYNLMKLTTSLALTGATVDQIRSYVMNVALGKKQEQNFAEDVVDNLLNVTLMSRYDYTKARQNGIDEALGSKILPPMDFISDPLLYDLPNLLSEKGKTLKSIKHIPYIGKFIYEHIKKRKSSSTFPSMGSGLPSL